MKYSLLPILGEAEFYFSAGVDSNTGRGYGRLGKPNGAGMTKSLAAPFPYAEDDEERKESDEIDEMPSDDEKTRSVVNPSQYAPPGGRGDRGSFIKGRGLGEVGGISNPKWIDASQNNTIQQNNIVTSRGINHTSTRRKSGEKTGWSTRPPAFELDNEIKANTIDDILSNDEKALERTRLTHEKMVEEFRQINWGKDE